MDFELLNKTIRRVFKEEELVLSDPDKMNGFDIDPVIKKISSTIGLPNTLTLLNMRFFMNFTKTSEDRYVSEKFDTDRLYTFGMKVHSPYMWTDFRLENLGSDRKYNFEDMSKLSETLTTIEKVHKSYIMDELIYAGRICLDTKNGNRIIDLDLGPFRNEVVFINSSFDRLALSISAFCSSPSSQEFINNMNQIDPPAMEEHDYFWTSAARVLDDFFYDMDSD